jgi:hypothetical protein
VCDVNANNPLLCELGTAQAKSWSSCDSAQYGQTLFRVKLADHTNCKGPGLVVSSGFRKVDENLNPVELLDASLQFSFALDSGATGEYVSYKVNGDQGYLFSEIGTYELVKPTFMLKDSLYCIGPDGELIEENQSRVYYQFNQQTTANACNQQPRVCINMAAAPYLLGSFTQSDCYEWRATSSWSACGGVSCLNQTRTVACFSHSTNMQVADTLCHAPSKLATQQACPSACVGQCGSASASFANNVTVLPTPYCVNMRTSDANPAVWVPTPGGSYSWTCGNVTYGDITANCQATIDILPVCGADNRAFAWDDNTFGSSLCAQGVLSSAVPTLFSGSSTAWSCRVNGRGTTASCSATRA